MRAEIIITGNELLADQVLNTQQKLGIPNTVKSKIFKLTGIAEAFVQDKVKEIGDRLGDCDIAYLMNPGEVQLKIAILNKDPGFIERRLKQVEERVEEHFGEYIFGKDNERPEMLVGSLLVKKNLTIGLAESCTGGLIGAALTSVPGSSRYFLGGIISYANHVKEKVLGVPEEILARYGAVSEETAGHMALGARRVLGSDIGLAVTGVAGPGGGTPQKPVGLVYIALYDGKEIICHRFTLSGARTAVRKGAVNVGLNMVRQYLAGNNP